MPDEVYVQCQAPQCLEWRQVEPASNASSGTCPHCPKKPDTAPAGLGHQAPGAAELGPPWVLDPRPGLYVSARKPRHVGVPYLGDPDARPPAGQVLAGVRQAVHGVYAQCQAPQCLQWRKVEPGSNASDPCPHCPEDAEAAGSPSASEASCGPPEAQPEDAASLAAVRTRPRWRFPRISSPAAAKAPPPTHQDGGRGGARRPLLAGLLLLAAAVLVPLFWDLGVLGAHGLMREAPAKAAPTRVQVAVPEDGTVEAEVEMAFRHNALLATSLELRRVDCQLLTAEGLPAAALATRGASVASLAPGLFRPGGPPGRVATTVRGTEIDVDRLFDAATLSCELRLEARFMGFARAGFTLPASYDLKAAEPAAPEERATFDVQRFVRDIRVGAPEADGLNLEVNMKHFNTTVLSLRKALLPFRDTLEAADLEVRGTRPEVSFAALADGERNEVRVALENEVVRVDVLCILFGEGTCPTRLKLLPSCRGSLAGEDMDSCFKKIGNKLLATVTEQVARSVKQKREAAGGTSDRVLYPEALPPSAAEEAASATALAAGEALRAGRRDLLQTFYNALDAIIGIKLDCDSLVCRMANKFAQCHIRTWKTSYPNEAGLQVTVGNKLDFTWSGKHAAIAARVEEDSTAMHLKWLGQDRLHAELKIITHPATRWRPEKYNVVAVLEDSFQTAQDTFHLNANLTMPDNKVQVSGRLEGTLWEEPMAIELSAQPRKDDDENMPLFDADFIVTGWDTETTVLHFEEELFEDRGHIKLGWPNEMEDSMYLEYRMESNDDETESHSRIEWGQRYELAPSQRAVIACTIVDVHQEGADMELHIPDWLDGKPLVANATGVEQPDRDRESTGSLALFHGPDKLWAVAGDVFHDGVGVKWEMPDVLEHDFLLMNATGHTEGPELPANYKAAGQLSLKHGAAQTLLSAQGSVVDDSALGQLDIPDLLDDQPLYVNLTGRTDQPGGVKAEGWAYLFHGPDRKLAYADAVMKAETIDMHVQCPDLFEDTASVAMYGTTSLSDGQVLKASVDVNHMREEKLAYELNVWDTPRLSLHGSRQTILAVPDVFDGALKLDFYADTEAPRGTDVRVDFYRDTDMILYTEFTAEEVQSEAPAWYRISGYFQMPDWYKDRLGMALEQKMDLPDDRVLVQSARLTHDDQPILTYDAEVQSKSLAASLAMPEWEAMEDRALTLASSWETEPPESDPRDGYGAVEFKHGSKLLWGVSGEVVSGDTMNMMWQMPDVLDNRPLTLYGTSKQDLPDGRLQATSAQLKHGDQTLWLTQNDLRDQAVYSSHAMPDLFDGELVFRGSYSQEDRNRWEFGKEVKDETMSVDMDLILADEELVEVNLRVRNYKKDDRESMTAGADATLRDVIKFESFASFDLDDERMLAGAGATIRDPRPEGEQAFKLMTNRVGVMSNLPEGSDDMQMSLLVVMLNMMGMDMTTYIQLHSNEDTAKQDVVMEMYSDGMIDVDWVSDQCDRTLLAYPGVQLPEVVYAARAQQVRYLLEPYSCSVQPELPPSPEEEAAKPMVELKMAIQLKGVPVDDVLDNQDALIQSVSTHVGVDPKYIRIISIEVVALGRRLQAADHVVKVTFAITLPEEENRAHEAKIERIARKFEEPVMQDKFVNIMSSYGFDELEDMSLKSKAVSRIEPEIEKTEPTQQVAFFCIADACFGQGAGIGILAGAVAAVFIVAAVAFRCFCSPAARAAKAQRKGGRVSQAQSIQLLSGPVTEGTSRGGRASTVRNSIAIYNPLVDGAPRRSSVQNPLAGAHDNFPLI